MRRFIFGLTVLVAFPAVAKAQARPFGPLEEQAGLQQQWLEERARRTLRRQSSLHLVR